MLQIHADLNWLYNRGVIHGLLPQGQGQKSHMTRVMLMSPELDHFLA